MDIKIVSPAPVPTAPTTTPGNQSGQAPEAERVPPPRETKADNTARERRQRNDDGPKPPQQIKVRHELRIDEATKQVFGRVVDSSTGDAIREVPAEEIRHLRAISRELFGAILDKTV